LRDGKRFIETRDYLRKFTPHPSECPEPPVNYWKDFLTSAEEEYISKISKLCK
jgi:hypothetical protein